MYKKLLLACATASLGLVALAGCAPMAGSANNAPTTSQSSQSSAAQESAVSGGELTVGQSSLGPIIADGTGKTVYVYDKDTANSGKSDCEGDCLVVWPPVLSTDAKPKVSGVTGTVGTITRTDGTKQVTVNGLPVYYYATDSAAGDVQGQGIGGIWWVVNPAGVKITKTASGSGGSGGY